MKVNDLHGILKGTDPRDSRVPDQAPARRNPDGTRNAHGDSLDLTLSVSLSDISSRVASEAPDSESHLTPDRLAEIRSRLDTGFYGQTQALQTVADGILDFYGR